MLDAGAPVAIATNCNPGSSYTTSMAFCLALAVRDMRMTTEEALLAATSGGARALRRTDVGHLAPGARADLAILDAPSYSHLVYRPGVPLVARHAGRRRALGMIPAMPWIPPLDEAARARGRRAPPPTPTPPRAGA